MSEFEDYQARIAAALDRMADVVDRLGAGDSAVATLKAQLEAEREANAQLESRVRSLRAAHEEDLAGLSVERDRLQQNSADQERQASETGAAAQAELESLREECDRLREALSAQSAANAELKKSSGELAATMKVLREAQTADLVDAHLLNRAMQKELNTLHAARADDRAEMDAILAALQPLVEEKQDA